MRLDERYYLISLFDERFHHKITANNVLNFLTRYKILKVDDQDKLIYEEDILNKAIKTNSIVEHLLTYNNRRGKRYIQKHGQH
jgi:hypothetical protein|tara:strand:+ start:168 stop:416 length:249 start_codon:yes stop_codon:yes gene_type:complete